MSLMPGFLDKYGSVARAYQSICKAAIWRSPLKACPRAGPWSVRVAAQSSSVGGGQSILVAAGVAIVGMITRPVPLSRCYMPGPAQACSDRRLRALQSRIDKGKAPARTITGAEAKGDVQVGAVRKQTLLKGLPAFSV